MLKCSVNFYLCLLVSQLGWSCVAPTIFHVYIYIYIYMEHQHSSRACGNGCAESHKHPSNDYHPHGIHSWHRPLSTRAEADSRATGSNLRKDSKIPQSRVARAPGGKRLVSLLIPAPVPSLPLRSVADLTSGVSIDLHPKLNWAESERERARERESSSDDQLCWKCVGLTTSDVNWRRWRNLGARATTARFRISRACRSLFPPLKPRIITRLCQVRENGLPTALKKMQRMLLNV